MFHKIYIKPEAFEENLLKMKEVRSNKILFRDAEKLKFHKIPKIRDIFILSKEESKRDNPWIVKIKFTERKKYITWTWRVHVFKTSLCLMLRSSGSEFPILILTEENWRRLIPKGRIESAIAKWKLCWICSIWITYDSCWMAKYWWVIKYETYSMSKNIEHIFLQWNQIDHNHRRCNDCF